MKRLALVLLLFSCSGKKDTPDPNRQLIVSTIAGSGTLGYLDANGTDARFADVWGVVPDNACNIFVADAYNNCIRKIAASGNVTTFAGSSVAGFANGLAGVARFSNPLGMTITGTGPSTTIYVADAKNHSIRMVTAGNVSTVAGIGTRGFADGPPLVVQFRSPTGIAINSQGILYVADLENNAIRAISPDGNVSTLAGTRTEGFADGNGTAARFNMPFAIAVDRQGNIYVADYANHRIRKVTPAGTVSTFAGSTGGYQDGVGEAAKFNLPRAVATDAQGNVYVADGGNNCIRKITPDGTVSTIAGSTAGYADGPALQAKFNEPVSISVDAQGNIYVGDARNYRIRKISRQ